MIRVSDINGTEGVEGLCAKMEGMRASVLEEAEKTGASPSTIEAAARVRQRAEWAASRLLSSYDRQEAGISSIRRSMARGVASMLDRAAGALESGDTETAKATAEAIQRQNFGSIRDQFMREPWDEIVERLAAGDSLHREGAVSGLRSGAAACTRTAKRETERAARDVRAREPELADAFIALEQTERDLRQAAGLKDAEGFDFTDEARDAASLRVG